MKKSTYDMINLGLDQIENICEVAIEKESLKEKVMKAIKDIKATVVEDSALYSGQRRGVKLLRNDLVSKNPALFEAANKLLMLECGGSIKQSELCDERYLRVIMTYVKDKMPDFRYYTFPLGEERVVVKTAGTPVADEGEHFEPTF